MCSANEIINRKTTDRMCTIADLAMLVADLKIGMMVFPMRDPGNGIHKGHGFMKIAELKIEFHGPCMRIQLPVVGQLGVEAPGLCRIQCLVYPGIAMLFSQIHGQLLLSMNRLSRGLQMFFQMLNPNRCGRM